MDLDSKKALQNGFSSYQKSVGSIAASNRYSCPTFPAFWSSDDVPFRYHTAFRAKETPWLYAQMSALPYLRTFSASLASLNLLFSETKASKALRLSNDPVSAVINADSSFIISPKNVY